MISSKSVHADLFTGLEKIITSIIVEFKRHLRLYKFV
jgi:hypothetical protein